MMLLAELNGKYDLAIQNDEDYLTSTVFSHLRYVAPGTFWHALFSRAKTLPIQGAEASLTAILGEEYDLKRYARLDVRFWPKCPGLGEPELAMCFTGGGQDSLVILVEVKLWSPKSGYGEHDQLKRYLQVADAIVRLNPPVPSNAKVVVVYLTPREAMTEVQESLTEYGDSEANRHRLFRLQWQDMIEAIDEAVKSESELSQMILKDVGSFLRVRRLAYFKGFTLPASVESLAERIYPFYASRGSFHGFQVLRGIGDVKVVKGGWVNAN